MESYFTNLIKDHHSIIKKSTITRNFLVNNKDNLPWDKRGKYFSIVVDNCDYISNIQSNVIGYCSLMNNRIFDDEIIIDEELIIIITPEIVTSTNISLHFYVSNDNESTEITLTYDSYKIPLALINEIKRQTNVLTKTHIYIGGRMMQHKRSFNDIFIHQKELIVKEINVKKDIDMLERNSNGYFFDMKINRSHNFITNVKLLDDMNNKIKLYFFTSSDCDYDNDTIINKSTYIIPMLCSKSLINFRFYFDIKDKPEYITLMYDNYIFTPYLLKYYSVYNYVTTNDHIYNEGKCMSAIK